MLILRVLMCAGLLAVSGLGLWVALQSRERALQIGAFAGAVASLLLVCWVLYPPAGVARLGAAPDRIVEEEPYE
jgi:hypothetical protein